MISVLSLLSIVPTKNVFQSFRDYQKRLGWTSFPSLTNSVDFALGSAWCLLFSFSSGSPSNFAGIANLCALLCIISGHWSVPIYSVFLLLIQSPLPSCVSSILCKHSGECRYRWFLLSFQKNKSWIPDNPIWRYFLFFHLKIILWNSKGNFTHF